MLRLLLTCALGLAAGAGHADCAGDLVVHWEKRPPGMNVFYEVVGTVRIDTGTGILSVCGSDETAPAAYARDDLSISFTYAGTRQTVYDNADGTFLSPPWTAAFEGATWEFRLRAIP